MPVQVLSFLLVFPIVTLLFSGANRFTWQET